MSSSKINSINDFLQQCQDYKDCYYRGQSNSSWEVSPSLFRKNASEERAVGNIKGLFYNQHYLGSTRLCDLSKFSLVALLFAISGNYEEDGAVYLYDSKNVVDGNSNKTRLLLEIMKPEYKYFKDIFGFSKKLFEKNIEPNELQSIVESSYIIEYSEFDYANNRSYLQGGTGILFGYKIQKDGLINKKELGLIKSIKPCKTIIIGRDLKKHLLIELCKMGITLNMLYENKIIDINKVKYSVELSDISSPIQSKVKVVLMVDNIENYELIEPYLIEIIKEEQKKYPKSSVFGWAYFDEIDKQMGNCMVHARIVLGKLSSKIESNYYFQRSRYILSTDLLT